MFNEPVKNVNTNGLFGVNGMSGLPGPIHLGGPLAQPTTDGPTAAQQSFVERLNMVMEAECGSNGKPAIVGGVAGTLLKPQNNALRGGNGVDTGDFTAAATAKKVDGVYVAEDFYADGLVIADGEIMVFTPVNMNNAGQTAFNSVSATSMAGALSAEDRIRQGNELMAAALEKVSSLLGLSQDTGYDEPFAIEFDPESVEQLANIIWYLDLTIRMIDEKFDASTDVAGALEALGQMGLSIQPANGADEEDSAALASLSAMLRKEKFNIEMAFRLLGANEMVSAMVAERTDKNISIGIPQAANPASLGMSTGDLVQAFASLIKEELSTAMDRVRAITGGQAEMTELEKAAIRLGTVKSEILKAALDANVGGDILERLNANFSAALRKGTDAFRAGGAEIANITGSVPLSAQEPAAGNIAEKNVEAANRRAFESVAMTAKNVTAGSVELPISGKEFTNRSANTGAAATTADKATGSVELLAARVNTGTDIPVSAAEAASRKPAANNTSVNNPNAGGLTNGAAGGRLETLAQNDFAVKGKDFADNNNENGSGKHHGTGANTGITANNAAVPGSAATVAALASAMPGETVITSVGAVETAGGESAGLENSGDSGEPQAVDSASSRAAMALEENDKARAALSRTVDQEAVIRQISERLQHAIRVGAHEMRITLRPEALGEVRMSIRVEGDVVLARMQVENSRVKEVIENNLKLLKDALEKQNLHVGGFSVDVDTGEGGSQRQTWREMADAGGIPASRRFKEGADGSADGNDGENDPLAAAPGSDTGRRFGSNTFEYFI
jgi:flagellar hook-length control protein FliK